MLQQVPSQSPNQEHGSRSTKLFDWSHDALRAPDSAFIPEDRRNHPFAVRIPTFLVGEAGFQLIRASGADFAFWPAPGLPQTKWDESVRLLIDRDWLDYNRVVLDPGSKGTIERDDRESHRRWIEDRDRLRRVEELFSTAESRLRQLLQNGLAQSRGSYVPSLAVYQSMVARGIEHESLRVCEACELVFEARTAWAVRCQDCPNPRRFKIQPHHTNAVLMRRGQGASFLADCAACGQPFSSSDPRIVYCHSCGDGRGRERRHRKSHSAAPR